MGATQDLCSRCSACCQGGGSGTRAWTRLRVATRLLPVETWRLRLETGPLGASSGEACDVGPTSMGKQSPRLVQHAGTLATLRPQVVAQSNGVDEAEQELSARQKPWSRISSFNNILARTAGALPPTCVDRLSRLQVTVTTLPVTEYRPRYVFPLYSI